MTDTEWAEGAGLGRAELDGRPVMVLHVPGTGQARIATVGGRHFADLPDLLEAAGGAADRIVAGDGVKLAETDLLSPAGRPRKIVCVGQNYGDHVKEGGRTSAPPHPDVFAKWDNALSGPYADLPLPAESDQIDYESELAVVIGRSSRRVAADDVLSVVFGYTAANDGSVRDYQFHTGQRTAGKAWDSLTPLGPVVVPAAWLGGMRPDLRITGRFNGETVQDDRTSNMIYGLPEIIVYLSTFMTLEPGDILLTGTPAGVGAARKPPRYLTDGDEFEVSIEGIGALRNRYRAEKS